MMKKMILLLVAAVFFLKHAFCPEAYDIAYE